MTPEELNSLVLQALREFEAKYSTTQKCPTIARFDSFFQVGNGVSLREAFRNVFHLTKKESIPENILAGIPGVVLFEGSEGICVRLSSSAVVQPKPAVADVSPSPDASDSPTALPATDVSKLSKDELKAMVLEDVGLFSTLLAQKGKEPSLEAFNLFFSMRRGVGLSKAFRIVFGLSKKESAPASVLRMLPDVEVYESGGTDCVRPVSPEGTDAPVSAPPSQPMHSAEGRTSREESPSSVPTSGPARPGSVLKHPPVNPGVNSANPAKRKRRADRSPAPVITKPDPLDRKRRDSMQGRTLAALSGIHSNCIASLRPSRKWTILVDETGSNFFKKKGEKDPFVERWRGPVRDNQRTPGKLVALVLPEETKLPPIPMFHAADGESENVTFGDFRAVIDQVLNSNCGVLGVEASALPDFRSEQWISCIETLLEIIVRMLPLPPDGATVDFLVERRFEMDRTVNIVLKTICDDILFRVSKAFPGRAGLLKLSPRFITKFDSDLNGYVDAIANLWGSPSPRKKELLRKTGWSGSCLFPVSGGIVQRFLSDISQESEITPEEWSLLLSARKEIRSAPYFDALLNLFGETVRTDLEKWKRLLNETVLHIESNSLDTELLSLQMDFLKKWEPDAADRFPPRLSLLWLMAEVVRNNHQGRIQGNDSLYAELAVLAERLRREDRDLCVQALLNLAVSHTNAFEFGKARELLLPIKAWPSESLGLRMAGQLLSSLGQHEAFLGNPVGALSLFDEAVSLFRDLSEGSAEEIGKTRAYAATAAMDAKAPDANDRFAEYLWDGPYSDESLSGAARTIAKVSAPEGKYKHHILLRRLVELPADHPARAAYLEEKPRWSEPAVGHPWELIEFYRALLLPPGDERNARFESAYEITLADGGPTLRVIAAVISGSNIANADDAARDAYADLVAACAEALPALGESRLAALRGQLDPAARLDPLSLAKAVLPFNFR